MAARSSKPAVLVALSQLARIHALTAIRLLQRIILLQPDARSMVAVSEVVALMADVVPADSQMQIPELKPDVAGRLRIPPPGAICLEAILNLGQPDDLSLLVLAGVDDNLPQEVHESQSTARFVASYCAHYNISDDEMSTLRAGVLVLQSVGRQLSQRAEVELTPPNYELLAELAARAPLPAHEEDSHGRFFIVSPASPWPHLADMAPVRERATPGRLQAEDYLFEHNWILSRAANALMPSPPQSCSVTVGYCGRCDRYWVEEPREGAPAFHCPDCRNADPRWLARRLRRDDEGIYLLCGSHRWYIQPCDSIRLPGRVWVDIDPDERVWTRDDPPVELKVMMKVSRR
ncbi:MAG: hypothetical protein ACYC63_00500 [Armatimonadota bacterium]